MLITSWTLRVGFPRLAAQRMARPIRSLGEERTAIVSEAHRTGGTHGQPKRPSRRSWRFAKRQDDRVSSSSDPVKSAARPSKRPSECSNRRAQEAEAIRRGALDERTSIIVNLPIGRWSSCLTASSQVEDVVADERVDEDHGRHLAVPRDDAGDFSIARLRESLTKSYLSTTKHFWNRLNSSGNVTAK